MPATPPSKAELTYADYCAFPADGRRHELIGGEHFVTPAPDLYHQTLSGRLQFALYRQVEETGKGRVFFAPTDVQLSGSDIVQPDLLVVLAANQGILTPAKVEGAPDLVIEIASPSSEAADRGRKRDLYERSGVPEYWVVLPAERAIEQHRLVNGAYEIAGRRSGEIEFRGLPGVKVDLSRVW